MLHNRVDKLESQVHLLEDALINNEIKINNAGQDCKRNNLVIQGIPQSVKSEELEDKVIKVLDKVNVNVTKIDIEACHWLGDSRKTIVRLVNRKHLFEALTNKKSICLLIVPALGSEEYNFFFVSKLV